MDPEKETIKLYHDKNFKPCDILKKLQGLKISKSKVYRTCKRLSEGQSMDNRQRQSSKELESGFEGTPKNRQTNWQKSSVYQKLRCVAYSEKTLGLGLIKNVKSMG